MCSEKADVRRSEGIRVLAARMYIFLQLGGPLRSKWAPCSGKTLPGGMCKSANGLHSAEIHVLAAQMCLFLERGGPLRSKSAPFLRTARPGSPRAARLGVESCACPGDFCLESPTIFDQSAVRCPGALANAVNTAINTAFP